MTRSLPLLIAFQHSQFIEGIGLPIGADGRDMVLRRMRLG